MLIYGSSLIVGICLALLLLIYVGFTRYDYKEDQILRESKFDREAWIEAGSKNYETHSYHSGNCTRGKMYYDLKDNYLKKGMSKEDVFSLLGKPEYGIKFPDKKRQYCLEYDIGSCTNWFAGGFKLLLVCLKNDRITEVFKDSANSEVIANGKYFNIEQKGE